MRPIDLRVILVGSLYESNIGAVSRAMSNMEAQHLILLRPQCEITYTAQLAAATGQQALQNRRTYPDWKSLFAAEPEGLRIALTARAGRLREVKDLSETLEWCSKNIPQLLTNETGPLPVYLILGPEDAGLCFEDLQQAHYACSIPTYGANTSLNLAQAALLALYIVRQSALGGLVSTQSLDARKDGESVQEEEIQPLELTLSKWLEALGFEIRENQMSAFTVLKRLILHSVPTRKELRTLQVVLHQTVRKLTDTQVRPTARNASAPLEPGPDSIDDPPAPTAH